MIILRQKIALKVNELRIKLALYLMDVVSVDSCQELFIIVGLPLVRIFSDFIAEAYDLKEKRMF